MEKEKSSKVSLNGWVHDKRDLGGIKFVLLRNFDGITQITVHKAKTTKKILNIIEKLNQEDVISVKGEIVKSKEAPGGFEVIPSDMQVISKAETPLPLDPRGMVGTNFDTRLDWRVLDLRRPESLAVFKIQAKLLEGMNEWLKKNNFLQVFTPCLIGGSSEGGSEVFPVVYFNKEAYLRQDPQLHRQLLIAAGFNRVFDLGPSWRAELSHTPRHLCEHRGYAVEFSFMKDESDMMRVEEELVVTGLKKVKEECEKELKLLKKEITIPKTPFPELRFPKIYEILESMGKKTHFGEEYDRESEELLAKHVKEKYKTDFFFVNRFPFKAKPFYVMKVDEEPQWARSVDLIFKGMEQSSGGQREHRYEKIIQQLKEKGMDAGSMKWFTDPFRFGVPPHGGFCLGVERFTMQLLDLKNIKEATLFPRDPERLVP